MKKFLLFIITLFVCVVCYGATFNQYWYVEDNTPIQTSCTTGGDIILPTPPTKYGYDFIGWEQLQYVPIEYLESTGTQWIDTGVYANGGSKIEMKGKVINDSFWVGSISNRGNMSDADATRNEVYFLNNVLYFEKLSSYNNKTTIDKTKIFTFVFDTIGNNYIFILNGTRIFSTSSNILREQPNTISIGYAYWDSKIHSGRYYYMKIYDSTETLVRDFIPVLDKNGTPCMYDKVEDKFYYNAGTGDFIAGPVLNE